MSIKEKTNPGVIARIKKILVGDFVETGATASQNIGAGKFFVWRNKLKQAKSAISSGDTFTEGTNMEAVAEGALNALNSNLNNVSTDLTNLKISLQTSEIPSNGTTTFFGAGAIAVFNAYGTCVVALKSNGAKALIYEETQGGSGYLQIQSKNGNNWTLKNALGWSMRLTLIIC